MKRSPPFTLLLSSCWLCFAVAQGNNREPTTGPLFPPADGGLTSQIIGPADGIPAGAQKPEAPILNAGVAAKFDGPTELRHVLVLCIEFRDYRAPFGIGYVDSLMNFNVLDLQTGVGGFRDYYVENSYGQFIPESHVYGWFEAEHSLSFYTDTLDPKKAAPRRLVKEALEQANAKGVDFSLFDQNGDGKAGTVIVFTPKRIDAHFSRLRSHVEYQGIIFETYTIHETSLGVAVHEYGHALGLPDLYEGPSPFGYYDIMGSPVRGDQPGHLSAYSKILLGWIQPVVVHEPVTGFAMPNSHDNPFAVVIRGRNGTDWGYFVLENRVRKGYDGGANGTISGSGLLIYHIHEYSTGWSHVEQADGREDLEAYHVSAGWEGNRGDAGDFYPGTTHNTRFDPHSNPSSSTKAGKDTGVSITNISAPGDIMSIDVSFPLPIQAQSETTYPHGFALYGNYPNPFRTSTVVRYDLPEAADIDLSVFDAAGSRVAILESGWKPAGSHQISFEAGSLPSGRYFYRLRWGEFDVVKSALLVD